MSTGTTPPAVPDEKDAPPSAHPAGSDAPGACWLCRDLHGIAIHIEWSQRRGKPLWTAHEYPSGDPHPVKPCPVCTEESGHA